MPGAQQTLDASLQQPNRGNQHNILQPEVIRPAKKSFWRALNENGNAKCILLTGTIYSFIALTTWCQVLDSNLAPEATSSQIQGVVLKDAESQCQTYLAVPVIFAALLYIIYLMENWKYYIKQEQLITISIPSIDNWIERMKRSLPIVWWKVVCYHYTVFPCRHGSPATLQNRPLSAVSYQRISSCSARCCYNYLTHGFRDVSSVLEGLDAEPLIKIHFSKSFVFFTTDAAKEFEEQRKCFFHEYQSRDDYMEMREGMDLMDIDFPDAVVVVRDLQRIPRWRRKSTFLFSVLFLVAAPLRILLSLKTATLHYNVLKVFGMDARESNWTAPPYDEACNNAMPPSYSEIMMENLIQVPRESRPKSLFLSNPASAQQPKRHVQVTKSATFCLTTLHMPDNKSGSMELASGVRARGLVTPGYDPVSPAADRLALDCSQVLLKNKPQMLLSRSYTDPNLSQSAAAAHRAQRTVVRTVDPSGDVVRGTAI